MIWQSIRPQVARKKDVMPLVAHSALPTFAHLGAHGHDLLSLERARKQDIRELHIGFLNMMPDAALQATERQFIRLIGSSNRIAQFFVYPFSLPELDRSEDARSYIDQHYSRFADLQEHGLDALIITGANVAAPALHQERFWNPLIDVVLWAEQNVASILCSCLATHALLKYFHDIDRQRLPQKRWGVFNHRLRPTAHPLVHDVNTRFDAPHSRYNDISRTAFEKAGLHILAECDEGHVHMAVSPDMARVVYFQGHPEYDRNSLLKEYKREVRRFQDGELSEMPPVPGRYFPDSALQLIEDARLADNEFSAELELALEAHVDNTWGDTAKAIVNNWLGIVYQLTNLDRKQQFMPGVDPDNPLGITLQR